KTRCRGPRHRSRGSASGPTGGARYSLRLRSPGRAASRRRHGAGRRMIERRLPYFPWRLSRLPELFEDVLVPKRVHVLPVSRVPIGGELAVAREHFERPALPHRVVAGDVVAGFGLEDKEPTID